VTARYPEGDVGSCATGCGARLRGDRTFDTGRRWRRRSCGSLL